MARKDNSENEDARRRQPRTGAEQEWDPEDLARAEGADATPEQVERRRDEMRKEGRRRIDKSAP